MEGAQGVALHAPVSAVGVDEELRDADGGLCLLHAIRRELEAMLPERVRPAEVAPDRAAARVHVAQLVGRLARVREGGGQRVALVRLRVVGLARSAVLVDVAEVDDGLQAAVGGRHLVELPCPAVVLLHQVAHVVERAEVVHACRAAAGDPRLVAQHQELRDLLAAFAEQGGVADAVPVLRDELGEGVRIVREGSLRHLAQECRGIGVLDGPLVIRANALLPGEGNAADLGDTLQLGFWDPDSHDHRGLLPAG